MITHIDFNNFGSFENFIWKNKVRDKGNNIQKFEKLNIIYGRNYSGKTTLSRAFRSLEEKKLPPNFENINFNIEGEQGSVLSQKISSHAYDVRVYNQDFVKENLSFLSNQQNGEIKTFAIVGSENNDIESKVLLIEAELGSVENKTGVRYEYSLKEAERQQRLQKNKKTEDALLSKLRDYAKVIKENRDYGNPVYVISHINTDIKAIQEQKIAVLNSDDVTNKQTLLGEKTLPNVDRTIFFQPKIHDLQTKVFSTLQKTIAPSKPIQELLNNALLQTWVRNGILHHKEKRETCAFCRQPLPDDIWKVLDEHFIQESEELDAEIDENIVLVESEIRSIGGILTVESDQLYIAERVIFDEARASLISHFSLYRIELMKLVEALNKRKSNIFGVVDSPALDLDTSRITSDIIKLNEAITSSNLRTNTLAGDKEKVRNALRLNAVAHFMQTIGLDSEKEIITKLRLESVQAHDVAQETLSRIQLLEKDLSILKTRLKDERKGADRVNALLNHFFGHDGLQLTALEDGDVEGVKFQIMRGGSAAYNLSEGECSLIAFCYFMAKLQDIDSKDKDLIIYIDDPICSLDSNHVFFIFSLIESLIAKPIKSSEGVNSYNYKQLFISTHNYDFLKYLMNISRPSRTSGKIEYFLIERINGLSNISLMPIYLKNYISEFNYLFHQIHKCHDPEFVKIESEPFYGFGNNLRKFLETFLFFKFPHHTTSEEKIEKIRSFFEDSTSVALTNRLMNELSHLEDNFERCQKPLDFSEISRLACHVLDKIYKNDPEQYNAFLKSIGESARLS